MILENTEIKKETKITDLPNYVSVTVKKENRIYKVIIEKTILLRFDFLCRVARGEDKELYYSDRYSKALNWVHDTIDSVDVLNFKDINLAAETIERVFIKKLFTIGAILRNYSQDELDQNYVIAIVIQKNDK